MTTLFDVYAKEVEIDTPQGTLKYRLRPLSGRFLPKLYTVIRKFPQEQDGKKPTPQEVLAILDEATVADMHTLVVETLVASYPSEPRPTLEEFASQNLAPLFAAVVEVNFKDMKKE